jgi:SOS-response transcriptional repressor LexA
MSGPLEFRQVNLAMRQVKLLAFLEAWYAKHRRWPPMKLMVHAIGGTCSTDIYRVLRALGRKGFLTWDLHRIKTVRLTTGRSGGEQHQPETGVHHEHS